MHRGASVPVEVQVGGESTKVKIDMRQKPRINDGFISLGEFALAKGDKVAVILTTESAGGFVHADAVQIVPVK